MAVADRAVNAGWTLLCPGLEGPTPPGGDIAEARAQLRAAADVPSIDSLLTASVERPTRVLARGSEQSLYLALGGDESKYAPLGALDAESAGLDSACCLRIDPVEIRADSRDLFLIDAAPVLGEAERNAFGAALEAHFETGPLRAVRIAGGGWLACADTPIEHFGLPPGEALGRPQSTCRANGHDARAVDAFVNEAQMLLAQHALNVAREGRGVGAINSLWAWGAGPAGAPVERTGIGCVCGGGTVAERLAAWAGVEWQALPTTATAWLGALPASASSLLVLDALAAPAALANVEHWGAAARQLDSDWLAPLLVAAREQRVPLQVLSGERCLEPPSKRSLGVALARWWRRVRRGRAE